MESNIFRFANIFKLSNISVDKILSVVKAVKSETYIDLSCYTNLLSEESKLLQVKKVEEKLQQESSDQIMKNFTSEDLKTAAEMFIYLNMCPGTTKPWIGFYKYLFRTQSPDQIVLTLNRLVKGLKTPQNQYYKELAEILFKRIHDHEFMIHGKEEAPHTLEGT